MPIIITTNPTSFPIVKGSPRTKTPIKKTNAGERDING